MDITEFINQFRNQFDEPENIELTPKTIFREIPEWNSLTGLLTLAMVNDIYEVILPVEKMKQAETVQDLFDLVQTLSNTPK